MFHIHPRFPFREELGQVGQSALGKKPSILNELSDTSYRVSTSRIPNQIYLVLVSLVLLADELVGFMDLSLNSWLELS